MIEEPARRFGRRMADTGARHDIDRRAVRLLEGLDDAQRLVDGVKDLDGADDDALEGIGAGRPESGIPRRLAGGRRQPVEVEAVAGQRSDQV